MHASMFSAFALEVYAFRLLAALHRQRTVIVLQVATTDPYVRRLHTFSDDSIIRDGPIDQPNVRKK